MRLLMFLLLVVHVQPIYGQALAKVYEAVCKVEAWTDPKEVSVATGTAVRQQDGRTYILTASHNLADPDSERLYQHVQVLFSTRGFYDAPIKARIYYRGSRYDVAILVVDSIEGVRPIPIRELSSKCQPGDRFLSVGCPDGRPLTGFVAHFVEYTSDGELVFTPPPADGRSGASLVSEDGLSVFGMIHARRTQTPEGVAYDIGAIYQDETKTGLRKTGGQVGCPSPNCRSRYPVSESKAGDTIYPFGQFSILGGNRSGEATRAPDAGMPAHPPQTTSTPDLEARLLLIERSLQELTEALKTQTSQSEIPPPMPGPFELPPLEPVATDKPDLIVETLQGLKDRIGDLVQGRSNEVTDRIAGLEGRIADVAQSVKSDDYLTEEEVRELIAGFKPQIETGLKALGVPAWLAGVAAAAAIGLLVTAVLYVRRMLHEVVARTPTDLDDRLVARLEQFLAERLRGMQTG